MAANTTARDNVRCVVACVLLLAGLFAAPAAPDSSAEKHQQTAQLLAVSGASPILLAKQARQRTEGAFGFVFLPVRAPAAPSRLPILGTVPLISAAGVWSARTQSARSPPSAIS